MKKLAFLLVFILNFSIVSATHNRAGEITYVQLSDLTYEITITTYTYTLSLADRKQLNVDWGDNSPVTVAPRINGNGTILPNYYKKNIYKANHTYPGPGVYKIVVQDPNRNFGVRNIPNSVNVVFSISTILTVNPAMGKNSTPILLNPPYDKAALGYVFIHNPAAYDPDGDSLSYALTVCTRDDGEPIENYTLPPATRYLKVDSVSGDLIWNTPADTGIYNVAMEIQEWRNGRKIGAVRRDMQIEVFETNNKPPVNSQLKDLCVEAGDTVDFIVSSTDPNKDHISLKATSGIFSNITCPASFTMIDSVSGFISSRLRWIPCHEAVRNQPYSIIIKSDDQNTEVKLSDIDNMSIKVLGPPPLLLDAVLIGKYITLYWADYNTGAISGFNIYRREGRIELNPDSCTPGIPPSAGYVKVGYVAGSNSTSFTDTNNGQGLEFGREYNYRIVALYPNLTESKTSNEIIATLSSGIPVIRNVSVDSTSLTAGSIYVAWKNPGKEEIDTIPFATGPYEYRISRATGVSGTNYSFMKSITNSDIELMDSVFTDTPVDTRSTGYIYKIVLWNRRPGYNFVIGDSSYASSLFLTANPGDRKVRLSISRNVPWINERYDIFRKNNATLKYDSIGTTTLLSFADLNLENGTEYCYYIRSTGGYLQEGMPKNLINFSQKVCARPVDNEPPCPPEITVSSQCDSLYNTVRWTISDPACFEDIAGYKVYYKMKFDEALSLLATINDKNMFKYIHSPGDIIAGCYAVSAFDLNDNEGEKSQMVCIDSCNFYEIPNVFTPNGDDFNDRLIAKTSALVEKVDFKLFNRNGLMIFSTENPRIDWDGTYKGRIVSPGVYFYQCDVFETRISGLEQFHLSGFVHVITEEGAKVRKIETK